MFHFKRETSKLFSLIPSIRKGKLFGRIIEIASRVVDWSLLTRNGLPDKYNLKWK